MSISISVLRELVQALPHLRPQIYFKSSLTALSHAMEDQVLAGSDFPLVIATFQRERFYRQEAHRYRRIAGLTPQVYVMATPETEFKNASMDYETVAFDGKDPLSQEWNLVVLGRQYSTCLVCIERQDLAENSEMSSQVPMDQARPFEGIWTSDRLICGQVARLLLERIEHYRPELETKIREAYQSYSIPQAIEKKRKTTRKSPRTQTQSVPADCSSVNDPFAHRLVTYLQAGQHKLLRVYRSLAIQEWKERLVNSITAAIRQSLDPHEVLQIATRQLGEAMKAQRCLIYRCKSTDRTVVVQHEYLEPCSETPEVSPARSLRGETWPLQDNPLFQKVLRQQQHIYMREVADVDDLSAEGRKTLENLTRLWEIGGWLMVPILYQGQLLGMVELHQCASSDRIWQEDELSLVDAIATQLAAALIQAETYANLEDLNQQLEALERTRSNLIAITGHELRTPLSTIQVCLESLSQEPDMPVEMRQVMLETAQGDAERLRKLVQDFLTLSHLESGRVDWNPESLQLEECIDLAISGIRTRHAESLPTIEREMSADLPLVRADGEWLVELLTKLLDNACKFTSSEGRVTIRAQQNGDRMLEVTVADTGRGIEPNRLEAVFDRFYQEEGSLRRTVGGTGLGLAIGKQIVTGWGGKIWADSAGKDRGSQFHFTIPLAETDVAPVESKRRSRVISG
ncbi:DICT sensory domain-containing protein [Lyngbya sp. CCY1209]|uniref:DICT sensory domain-containing protein n=1 Tax=Lyngbya sp. CCY1209 TaxID=2886103 RepID=UPI002D201427|nr:DICT sensory domain-containing protein [Lyngbya sp. CCY1209]MEB3886356.1 GAF domain-containing protein [Lyngbya sp. CCY1209]